MRLSVASHTSGAISAATSKQTAIATLRARLRSCFCSLSTPIEPSTTRRVRYATSRSRLASLPVNAASRPASLGLGSRDAAASRLALNCPSSFGDFKRGAPGSQHSFARSGRLLAPVASSGYRMLDHAGYAARAASHSKPWLANHLLCTDPIRHSPIRPEPVCPKPVR